MSSSCSYSPLHRSYLRHRRDSYLRRSPRPRRTLLPSNPSQTRRQPPLGRSRKRGTRRGRRGRLTRRSSATSRSNSSESLSIVTMEDWIVLLNMKSVIFMWKLRTVLSLPISVTPVFLSLYLPPSIFPYFILSLYFPLYIPVFLPPSVFLSVSVFPSFCPSICFPLFLSVSSLSLSLLSLLPSLPPSLPSLSPSFSPLFLSLSSSGFLSLFLPVSLVLLYVVMRLVSCECLCLHYLPPFPSRFLQTLHILNLSLLNFQSYLCYSSFLHASHQPLVRLWRSSFSHLDNNLSLSYSRVTCVVVGE